MSHISGSLSAINMDVAHHKLTESDFHHVLSWKIRAESRTASHAGGVCDAVYRLTPCSTAATDQIHPSAGIEMIHSAVTQ